MKSGLSKHRKAGPTKYSPKLKHGMKRRAEQNERKAPRLQCKHSTVADALRRK